MHTKRAAIYIRTATAPGTREPIPQSVKIQQDACLEFCQRFQVDVVATFIEAASGFGLTDRPELTRLRKLVMAGGADMVVVHSIDRLSRDTEDLIIVVGEVQRHSGAVYSVVAATDPNDLGPIALEGLLRERERVGQLLQRIDYAE